MQEDKELFGRFVAGDTDAFERLVLTHKDNLIYFVSRYVNDIHICEDIAQEVFAAVFVYKDRYDGTVSFKTYLYAIAKNKAVDYLRKNARVEPLGDRDFASEEDELFERVAKNEKQRMVRKAVKELKEDYSDVIELVDFEGLSYKDAARIMRKTPAQLKVLLFRARGALKKTLVKGGYTNEN